ncbi:MAG: FGGY-family carbohydrate kinase, partial [Thermoproteota archaeon]
GTLGGFLLGTDIGTSATKTVLVDLNGREVASASAEYGVISLRTGWAEQWPDVWFNAVCQTIREVIDKTRINPRDIAGYSISSLYGGSGIPCDKNMEPLRPCLIWADRRATEECKWIRENIGEERVFQETCNTIDPYFGYTKMLWIKRNEPNVWSKIHQLVTPNAYCIYKLTGEISVDYSSIGNYGGVFNPREGKFAEELMEELGIPRSFFPEKASMSKDVVGEVSSEGSRLSGLAKGTPVCAGGIDAPMSALGVGALRDGELAMMLGTSTCNGFIQDEPRFSPKLVNYSHVAYDRQKFYSFAGIITAGYSVRWFRDNLGGVESMLSEKTGISAYSILDLEAEKVPPGSNGLIFLPHMMVGERAPWWDEYVRGVLFGLTLNHGKAHIFRAILEGVAYAIKYCVETAQAVEIPLRRAILVNGGAKSRLWRSIITNVLNREVEYIKTSIGAPYGDALLAGVGTKLLKGYEVIDEWISNREILMPEKDVVNKYSQLYEIYKKLYKDLEKEFIDLKKLGID